MRVYKEKTIPAKTIRECTHRICDICGTKGGDGDWTGSTYAINETEVSIRITQKEGNSCPDGGSGTKYDIDLCPTCFKNKLIPWLRSQGATIQEIEWDF
jgi:hypothetical protein